MYFVQLLLLIIIKNKEVDFFFLAILYSGLNAIKLNDIVHYKNKHSAQNVPQNLIFHSFRGAFPTIGVQLMVQCIIFNFGKNLFLYFQVSKCMTPYLLVAKDFLYFHSHAEPNLDSVHLMNLQHL